MPLVYDWHACHLSKFGFADLPTKPLYRLRVASTRYVRLAYCVTPSLNAKSGAGIFNLLPIAYSYWPRLRHRLTLSG